MSEPNIPAYLASQATPAGDRVYRQVIPQQVRADGRAYPCTVVTKVGRAGRQTQCGDDRTPAGSWQVDSYSNDPDEAVALADANSRAMVDYSGPMGAGFAVKVILAAEFDAPPDPEPGLYRRVQTYTIWYVES